MRVLDAARSAAEQARVAGALLSRGLVEGDRVVLSVPGSTDYVSVVLGAARVGIVPVPLDPRLTVHERELIVDDVEPAVVVEDDEMVSELLAGPPAELAPWPRCRPMHFTSGTTGRPKGVWSGLLPHSDAEALVMEERALWGFEAADLDLVVSPVYHSAPLRFAAGTLLAGGSIAMLPHFDAAAWADAIETLRPTTMFCVPAHLQRLFAHLDEAGRSLDSSSVRLLAHAGAPCPEPVRRRAHEQFGLDVVWEFYGSTEGQITACPAPTWHERPGTVGPARAGRTVHVDDDGQLWCTVPPWGRFEYWRDPAKTADAWRRVGDDDAFTVGDLGRLEDGLVFLDSRRSDLIISGGVNVYPAEVEAALEDVPGVQEIAVFSRPDAHWGQRVCAAYVGAVDEAALRSRAQERLAPPKRPKTYERVEALPRTATGKVRRGEL